MCLFSMVIGRLICQSVAYLQRQHEIQEEANRKRSEAATLQHEVSTPRHGETMVVEQVLPLPKEHKSREEKARIIGVNRGAVQRAE